MAARRGCCCLRSLISMLVIVALLVGSVYYVYTGTSLSTFGVKSTDKIGEFELGELVDVKFKDLYETVLSLFKPDESQIVDAGYNYVEADEIAAFTANFTPEENAPTIDGAAVTPENITGILNNPVIYTDYQEIIYTDTQLAYIFNLMIGGENEISDMIKEFGDISIAQLSLIKDGEKMFVKIIVKVDIAKIKGEMLASVPSFLHSMIGDFVYLTSINELTVTDGNLVVAYSTTGLKVNNIDSSIGDIILNAILSGVSQETEEEVTSADANKIFGDTFAAVVKNLGFVGRVEDNEGIKSRVSDATSLSAGQVKLVTHIASDFES